MEKKIEVIDGSSYGICQSEDMFFIRDLFYSKEKNWKEKVLANYKTLRDYFNTPFVLEENNKLVNDYVLFYTDVHSLNSIVMNVTLNGFDKVIKRKIIVNNNISIDKFCRAIIVSMQADLSHLYTIKINKKWYDEPILDESLTFLELSVGMKFSVIYDFGDNWEFPIRVSKIMDGYQDKEFEIIDGVGYGIVDDCGGVSNLYNVFHGTSEYFEQEDVNEFDLGELQKRVDKQLKIDNFHPVRGEYF